MKNPKPAAHSRTILQHLVLPLGAAALVGLATQGNAASPPPVSGYARWFDASQIAASNGSAVSTWNDLSGNGANATTPAGNASPTYVANAGTGTGLGALYFPKNTSPADSGALGFTRDSSIRTVFSVFKGNSLLLSDQSGYDFYRPSDTNPAAPLWGGYTNANIWLGSTYVNGELVDGTTYNMPTDLHNGFNLVEVLTIGNVQADSFNKDSALWHSGNQYQAEVIIYNRLLSESERVLVEHYLMTKWFGVTYPLNVSLSAPNSNQGYPSGVSVVATAVPLDGTSPYSVQFYRSSSPAGPFTPQGSAVTSAPYQTTLTGLANGSYYIKATVTDGASGTATSAVTKFRLGAPTVVSWKNPSPGIWSEGSNWDTDAPASTATTVVNFNQAGTYTSTQDMGDGFVLNRLNLGAPQLSLAGDSLNFAGTSPQINQNSASDVTIDNALALSATTALGGSGAGAVTLSGLISGNGALVKTTAGLLTLGGANTHSGGTSIGAGSLVLASSNAALGSGTLIMAGGTTFKVASGPGADITNPLLLTNGEVTVDVPYFGATDVRLGGLISGNGRLKVTSDALGRGLTLSNANTFHGGVLLAGGAAHTRLYISNPAALGTGMLRTELNSPGGGLYTAANLTDGSGVANAIEIATDCLLFVNTGTGNNLKLSGPISGSGGSLYKEGNATLTLTGPLSYTGTTTIALGTLAIDTTAGERNLSNVDGDGRLSKIGSGTLNLGSCVLAGTLEVTAGTLKLGTGVSVGTADLSSPGTGVVDATNPLDVTTKANLGGVELALAGGTSFTLGGPDLVTPPSAGHRVITVSSGILTITPPLPGTDGNIGGGSGYSTYNAESGFWQIFGTGIGDYSGDNHQWRYIVMPAGDFDISVRCLGGMWDGQRMGIMARDGLNKGANWAALYDSDNWTVVGGHAGTVGSDYLLQPAIGLDPPTWARLTKVGNTISSYYSMDGYNLEPTWTLLNSTTFPTWGSATYLGIDGTSCYYSPTFDNVAFLDNAPRTMPDWSTTDLVIEPGAQVELNYTGTTHIGTLTFNGVAQAPGTWGSSSALPVPAHVDDIHFAGTGTVTVSSSGSAAEPFASWITRYYGAGDPRSLPTADPDGDGLDNSIEYVLGTLPNTSNQGGPAAACEGGNFTFTFQRAAAAASPDTTIAIEVGTDLVSWPDVYQVGLGTGSSTSPVTVTPGLSPGFDTITLTIPQAPNARKFVRLRVKVTAP